MATFNAVWTPDYANTIAPAAGTTTGTIATGAATGVITVGKHRILHICGINITTPADNCVISFTMGLSTGTTAPSPTSSSPFFHCDEGIYIDTGDEYDQINLANIAAYNGASVGASIGYSVIIMSKF